MTGFAEGLSSLTSDFATSISSIAPDIIIACVGLVFVLVFWGSIKHLTYIWFIKPEKEDREKYGYKTIATIDYEKRKESFNRYWGKEYEEFADKYHNRISLFDSDGAYRVRRKHKYPNL